MKNNLQRIFRLLSLSLMLLLGVTFISGVLSGCGSSDAASQKKSKSKKSKSKKSSKKDEDDTETAVEDDTSKDEKETEKSADSSDGEKGVKKDDKSGKENNAEAQRIWKDLLRGNENFVAGRHTNGSLINARKQLTKGQKPEVIVLGCADSRVPPELVFDKNLGELFVVRAAGNIADPISLGSIEYAVEHLHSKVLVILGHESCGAVGAAVANEEMPTRNLAAIVNKISPALDGSDSCPLGGKMNMTCVELNARQSAKDVLKDSPIIKKAVEEGHLTIIQAVYNLESGKVVRLDEDKSK